jgi:hypothetical protein
MELTIVQAIGHQPAALQLFNLVQPIIRRGGNSELSRLN